ncbi:MAG: U32 family peptidase [Candidatus Bathyarchaeota archaeon]|nr:MAG: U32 family peptidase [Candidatus Bathyarchaeota archaeon]
MKPKILSPINSLEGGKRVIDAGADEVYCAVQIPPIKDFVLYRGPSSEIPSYGDLSKLVKYAHDRDIEIPLVVNWPFIADIIEKPIRDHIRKCIDSGVDALIVGDVGILSIIREMGIDIPLYASTYFMSMNTAAVRFLEKLGFDRVILERHMTIEEITKIAGSSKAGIEILIHGGGCSNINGSCYLFHYTFPELTEAQRTSHKSTPCALPFNLQNITDSSDKFEDTTVMDAFEYCSICKLPELIRTGITGFKIEGRTGSIWYQESTTRVYRELIDLIFERKMEEYERRLEELKNGVYFLPVPTNFYKLKEIWCLQNRCYYSGLSNTPYKIPLSWQTWTKQHYSWVKV